MPSLSALSGLGGINTLQARPTVDAAAMPNFTGGIKPQIPGQTTGVMSPTIQPMMPPQPGIQVGQQIPIKDTGPMIVPQAGQPGGQPLTPPNQPVPTMQSSQPFGLGGATSALLAGQQAGTQALQGGVTSGLGILGQGFQQGQGMLGQGIQAVSGNFSGQATNVDPRTGQALFQQAAQGVNQFTPAGLQAQQQALALSGAGGQEAFNQAMINNPGMALLQRRGQEALVNANAARGGLGSGQFQVELQQLGQAQAQQDLQRQFQNAMALSGQGLQAAGMGGQFLAQAGGQEGRLAAQNAAQQTQTSLANAANRLGAARSQAGLFGQGAGIAASLAGQGAGLTAQGGRDISNLLAGTAGQIANQRFQTGRDIAGQVASTTSGLSGLQNQQAQQLVNILGSSGVNIGNLLTGAGGAASGSQAQLAALLANLATGQGTTAANIAQQGGLTGAQLAINQGNATTGLLENLLTAFASREK